MKKLIALLLAVLVCLTLASCGDPNEGKYPVDDSALNGVETPMTEFPAKK